VVSSPGQSGYIPPEQLSTPEQMARITRAVEDLSASMKAFVDKWQKVGGMTLTEKQQRIVLGMELLSKAEQRVATLQNSQILLTEKLNDTKTKLTKVDLDLRPQALERELNIVGSTDTDERRSAQQQRLLAERSNLTTLYNQISSNLQQTNDDLRQARELVDRLQRMFLPQIENELLRQ